MKLETLPDLTQDKQRQRNTRKIQNEKPLLSLPTVTTDYILTFLHLQWERFGCFGHNLAYPIPKMTKKLTLLVPPKENYILT